MLIVSLDKEKITSTCTPYNTCINQRVCENSLFSVEQSLTVNRIQNQLNTCLEITIKKNICCALEYLMKLMSTF